MRKAAEDASSAVVGVAVGVTNASGAPCVLRLQRLQRVPLRLAARPVQAATLRKCF